jgi:ATP-binding cassette subfamily A (ABC1) protein 3
MQWHNIWTPVTADDDLVLGHVMIMLLVDSLIYILLTLYIEAVAPGEYGVPKHWYFPFQVCMTICISKLKLIYSK